jgi:N-formylmaleamate deformylase
MLRMSVTWSASDVTANGVQLRCYRLGDGPPLLLLHGIGSNARTWGRAAEMLAARRLVVAPDFRGHGQSAKPERGYRDVDYIADVEALMPQVADGPIDVIAHSFGGRIAAELAARRPDLFRRLVLEEAIGGPSAARPAAQEAEMREGAGIWIERLRQAPRDVILEQTRQRQPGWTEDECAAFVDSQREFAMAIYGPDNPGYFWDWRPVVTQLAFPTLVLLGDTSAQRFPPSGADETTVAEVRHLLAQASVVQINGAGHMLHLDQPDRFVAAVESFLV